jgi:hypothetical protein
MDSVAYRLGTIFSEYASELRSCSNGFPIMASSYSNTLMSDDDPKKHPEVIF